MRLFVLLASSVSLLIAPTVFAQKAISRRFRSTDCSR